MHTQGAEVLTHHEPGGCVHQEPHSVQERALAIDTDPATRAALVQISPDPLQARESAVRSLEDILRMVEVLGLEIAHCTVLHTGLSRSTPAERADDDAALRIYLTAPWGGRTGL